MQAHRYLLSSLIILLLTLTVGTPALASDRCSIAWSHYTGWEPWGYIADSGIAEKWGDKYDVSIEIELINDYIESINQFTAGTFDGVTATNMDALTIPAVGGVDTTVLIVGDFSNGNDAILVREKDTAKKWNIKSLAGQRVALVELSVSHYLLARALDMNQLSERDLTPVNTSDADIASVFLSGGNGTVVVTWNPIVMSLGESLGEEARILFDSSQIPGEIIDTLVVRTDVSDACKRALTGAWYEAMGLMAKSDQTALAAMAEQAGGTLEQFRAQLGTTSMFYDASEAVSFVRGSVLRGTMDKVRQFSFDKGLFAEGAPSPDVVGIEFPDGSVLGDKGNVTMRFDDTYMELAAKGQL
ncbi:MAG: putative urea ABC transporter substrate-binding protein [Acidobacteriota bacterium]